MMDATARARHSSSGNSNDNKVLRVSTCATAAVLAGLSEDEGDSSSNENDGDSLYPTGDDEYESDKENSLRTTYAEQNRRLQYALFPLPPSSSSSSSHRHHHRDHTGGQLTRASTPVSPAFSPHQPPRMPLPQLPDKPSPLLNLPRSREGSGYFQLPTQKSLIRERLHTWEEDSLAITRSPRSSNDTLSPILPYLSRYNYQSPSSEPRSRNATVRPFEEKLSIPPSPLYHHEFPAINDEASPLGTPTLSLEPPLPIEPRPTSPSVPPEVPLKSPSLHSLQQFDDMLSIALEAMAEASAAAAASEEDEDRSVSSVNRQFSDLNTSRISMTLSSTCHLDGLDDFEETPEAEDSVWSERRTWSRSSSEESLPLPFKSTAASTKLQARPNTARKQSKIVFDDISSSDEEAFDMLLDADTILARQKHAVQSAQAEQEEDDHEDQHHYSQQHADILYSPEASSVSSSNWASRRDSLATQTSQTSSAGTSATSCMHAHASHSTTTDLGATLKQGLRIHHDGTSEEHLIMEEKEMTGLVPSTPWASSLVRLPVRKASRANMLDPKHTVQSQGVESRSPSLPGKTTASQASTPSPPQGAGHSLSHLSSLRSRLPKMGMSSSRRPSDTPSYTSASFTSVSAMSSSSLSPSPPSSTRASLAAFSINKLRSTRSTPLLRRKMSSQLPTIGQGSPVPAHTRDANTGGASMVPQAEDAGLAPPIINPAHRKGSLPELPSRFEMGMRRRASFLPMSMRRTSNTAGPS